MMHTLYNIGIYTLSLLMQLAGFWHPKIKKGVEGRARWRQHLSALLPPNRPKTLWMHVASLGEFEQGRPVIEQFKQRYPDWHIVLTFFSPSGYELRKNYAHADTIIYLPLDTPANARAFLNEVRPDFIIFVKYEFWANYLLEAQKRQIPTVLIAALFRPEQYFFQWYGAWGRRMLGCFTHFFVQNQVSADLLRGIGYPQSTLAGDTRIDRVLDIAVQASTNDIVAAFARQQRVLVVGSSWQKDEDLLVSALQHPDLAHLKVICAPHEPSPAHVNRLLQRLGTAAVAYSATNPERVTAHRWLIIDNVGMLNTLYRYGHLAYIGGGFGTGIHNTLEPAAFGLPVIFGPKYHKFEEAQQLIQRRGFFSIGDAGALQQTLLMLQQETNAQPAKDAIQQYLRENSGGTDLVLQFVQRGFRTIF
jgi:3-deoxy-D-manno-octulosonic-acid transferase